MQERSREPRRGGIVRVLEVIGRPTPCAAASELLARVPLLSAHGVELHVLLPRETATAQALRELDVPVAVAPVDDEPRWNTLRLACELVRQRGLDVVHTHYTSAHVTGALVAALTGRRCLAHVHADALHMLALEACRLHDSMHVGAANDAALMHARAIGIPADRLHRLTVGVRHPARSECGELQRLIGVPAGVPIVGWIGRMRDAKRPTRFVRVAAHVARRRDDVRFAMIGDGPLRDSVASLAKALDVADRVHLVGGRSDVAALAASLTALVLLPVDGAMPLVAIEAMAAGVPIVTVANGALHEAVVHGETGLVVDDEPERIGDALVALLAAPCKRDAMSDAAREHARRHYALADSAAAYAALYAQLAEQSAD